jgi:hypothetical protein
MYQLQHLLIMESASCESFFRLFRFTPRCSAQVRPSSRPHASLAQEVPYRSLFIRGFHVFEVSSEANFFSRLIFLFFTKTDIISSF